MKKFLSIMIAALMCLSLVSCSGESPETYLGVYLDALKNFDEAQMKEFGVYDSVMSSSGMSSSAVSEEDLTQMYKDILSGLSYEIKDSKVDGNTATVQVSITNTDMKNMVSNYVTSIMNYAKNNNVNGMSKSEMEKKVMEILLDEIRKAKESGITKTTEITVTMTKVDDKWQVSSNNSELIDAVTGGLLSAASSLQN